MADPPRAGKRARCAFDVWRRRVGDFNGTHRTRERANWRERASEREKEKSSVKSLLKEEEPRAAAIRAYI